jgi:hypothetical protein
MLESLRWMVYGPQVYLTYMCWVACGPSMLSDICVWADFYGRVIGHMCLGWFTKPARYQTYVQNLSIDKSFFCMRY